MLTAWFDHSRKNNHHCYASKTDTTTCGVIMSFIPIKADASCDDCSTMVQCPVRIAREDVQPHVWINKDGDQLLIMTLTSVAIVSDETLYEQSQTDIIWSAFSLSTGTRR
jgi:hypothetical protein